MNSLHKLNGKKMKKAQNISLEKLVSLIQPAKRVLVATHENPDGDGIGSILAFGSGLEQLGKQVVYYIKDPVPKMYHYLPGWQKIIHTLEKKQRFELSFIADLGEVERVSDEFLHHGGRGLTISLDHHIKGEHNADYNFCLPEQAATGEVIYKILKELQVRLDKSIATNIYTAIVTDTGSFKYSNTRAETFGMAAELLSCGVDPWEVALNCFETYSLPRMELLKKVMASMQVHRSKKIAWIVFKQGDFKKTGASPDEAEGFINFPRSIEGVEVAVAFKEQKGALYKVSLRSKNYVDVAAVALKFGGGGHVRASGFKVEGAFESVKKKVLKELVRLV